MVTTLYDLKCVGWLSRKHAMNGNGLVHAHSRTGPCPTSRPSPTATVNDSVGVYVVGCDPTWHMGGTVAEAAMPWQAS